MEVNFLLKPRCPLFNVNPIRFQILNEAFRRGSDAKRGRALYTVFFLVGHD